MAKKNGKPQKPLKGLRNILNAEAQKRLKKDIVDIKKPFLETEVVLVAASPEIIDAIIEHVQECEEEFVTLDHPSLAPELPAAFATPYQFPIQITVPRQRVYFMDREFYLQKLKCEVRQEPKGGDFWKQTTKVGGGGTLPDPTMDRMEQAAFIRGFGFNIYAIGDPRIRRRLLESTPSEAKPVLSMYSQRTRILYHPEGNPNVQIEMALERIHIGQTFTGYEWSRPKIDLEIVIGPEDRKTRHKILENEVKRLMKYFPLERQLVSSPTEGFEEIREALQSPRTRANLDKMGTREQWWRPTDALVLRRA